MRTYSQAAACLLAVVAVFASPAAAAQQCHITFRADGAEPLGGLELRVDYAAAAGSFDGSGDGVKCTGLAPASWQLGRDDDAGMELNLGLISGAGVPLPQDVWRCDFTASDAAPSPDDFVVTVDDALTPLFEPVSVEASVSDIACDGGAICGNGRIEAAEECDDAVATAACDGDCLLTHNSQRCDVTFVAGGTGSLGGVQFGVDYSDAFGEFQGEGVDVDCSQALTSTYTAVQDVDADQILNLALVSPGGLASSTSLWTCTFVTGGVLLATSDFQFIDNFHYINVSAVDVEAKAISVGLSAFVSACVFGPYCGDGNLDPEETCDDGNTTAGDCCSPTCAYESAATVCRSAVGGCDAPENCTGTSTGCPADAKRNSAFVCRASAGACDLAENCNGTSATCPADARSTSVCRPSSGFCDVAETCTGAATTCPVDQFKASGTVCNDDLFCNGADTCGGGTCNHAGSPCPGADGDSDCTETCAEASDTCTANDPELSTCNDANANTSGDQCVGGTCVGTIGGVLCGDANANGTLQSSDALQILRTAVGTPGPCAPQRCDTDNSGSITSSDALRVLKKAVGQVVPMNCPA